jgi:hypothetical protein
MPRVTAGLQGRDESRTSTERTAGAGLDVVTQAGQEKVSPDHAALVVAFQLREQAFVPELQFAPSGAGRAADR